MGDQPAPTGRSGEATVEQQAVGSIGSSRLATGRFELLLADKTLERDVRKLLGLILVLALLGAACSSGDDIVVQADPSSDQNDEPAPEPDEPADEGSDDEPAASSGGSDDLCALGAQLDADDPLEGVTLLDGQEFFDAADDLWGQVAAVAPGELQDDVAAIAGGLDEMQSVLETYDYDFFNEELSTALDNLDTSALDTAGDAFEEYMNDVCGLDFAGGAPSNDSAAPPGLDPAELDDIVEDFENVDPDDAIALLTQIFGIDEELAKCLNDELGTIDPDNLDAAVMTQEVCGTTLLEVVSGIGG